jgi:hypothetical protein
MKTQLPASWARMTACHAVSHLQAPRFRLPGAVLLLLILAASGLMADQITTSSSTRTLQPFESLTTENSLRQGLKIAEIGMSDLTADLARLEEKDKGLQDEAKAFEQKQKDEQVIVNQLSARFEEGQKQYLERFHAYDQRRTTHDADALEQQAAARASNSLAPERRDPATVSRINDWAKKVNDRKALLEEERALVNQERELVESKRQAALSYQQGATARLKEMHDALEAKIKAHNFKKGLAYQQLQQCADYAVKIRKILATKFNDAEVFSPILNGTMERLKKASGSGFDNP